MMKEISEADYHYIAKDGKYYKVLEISMYNYSVYDRLELMIEISEQAFFMAIMKGEEYKRITEATIEAYHKLNEEGVVAALKSINDIAVYENLIRYMQDMIKAHIEILDLSSLKIQDITEKLYEVMQYRDVMNERLTRTED